MPSGFFEIKDDLEGCRCSGRKKNRGHCPVLNDDGAKWPIPSKYYDLSFWEEWARRERIEDQRRQERERRFQAELESARQGH